MTYYSPRADASACFRRENKGTSNSWLQRKPGESFFATESVDHPETVGDFLTSKSRERCETPPTSCNRGIHLTAPPRGKDDRSASSGDGAGATSPPSEPSEDPSP